MKKITLSISALVACGLRFGKLSFIAGSKTAFFSVSQIAAPLIGIWGGWQATLLSYLIRTTVLIGTLPFASLASPAWLLLAYHIPTTSASAYLSTQSRLRAIIPMAAIAAYLLHPIGMQAPWYALYWLIPLYGAFSTRFLFIQALSATFTAHAVGTLMYLYAGKLSYQAIMLLTPIVALERLTYACAITLCVWGVNLLSIRLKERHANKAFISQGQHA